LSGQQARPACVKEAREILSGGCWLAREDAIRRTSKKIKIWGSGVGPFALSPGRAGSIDSCTMIAVVWYVSNIFNYYLR